VASWSSLTTFRARPAGKRARLERETTRRVAYVVSNYPLISHAFVQREVQALRALGLRVKVFSVHRAPPAEVLSEADASELASTTAILPVQPIAFFSAHARAFLRSPRAYLATLDYARSQAPRGARAKLWQLFYFAEAVVVWNGCRAQGIRHVHAHFANVGSDVAWLASEFGRRTDDQPWQWSFTMHGCMEFWEVERFNLARKVAAADLVLCISDFTRGQLMALCEPEHWHKFEVVHCGVDLDRFEPGTPAGDDSAPVEILSVGRLSHEKGQPMLLAAVAELRRRGLAVRLTMVGDGPLRAELEADAARLGITDLVTFTGALGQDELPAIFRRADIFCQPSFMEGIPVVLMEAMATGLPVVSSRVAGIPELVAEGESGLLVSPGRPDLLAAALAQLVEFPDKRADMGRRGRTIVEQDFDSVAGARRISGFFSAMAQ
jgi:colanic acid/amylovoran biosynthesis glycosyltransferase